KLTGTATVAAVSGVASFAGLSIDKSGAGYTLTGAATGLTTGTSATFNVTAGEAAQLVFTVQPSNATAGLAITPAVSVTAQDALGNTVTGFTGTVTVAIGTNPGGGTLAGSTSMAAVSGVATFSDLSINNPGTGYRLRATSSGLTGISSAQFNITAVTRLVFTVEPGNIAAGGTITPAVQVTAEDAAGRVATGFTGNVTVAIGTNPSGGTLGGTKTVAAVAGVATFGDLSVDKAGTGYTLTAAATGLTTPTSAAFNVSAGGATHLVFAVQPSNATAGAAIAPAIQLTAEDAQGNTDPSFTGNVAVAIGANPGGGTLAGTTSVAAVNGVATFANVSIDKVGTGYTLAASATGPGGATSTAFNITPGVASHLVFSAEPTTTTAGSVITPAVQVTAQDAQGNTAAGFTGNVSVAIGTNPGGGTLSGTATAAAVAGVVSFGSLSIDKAGTGYTLTTSATGLTGANSSTFNIEPAAANRLVFTGQPTSVTAGATITPAVTVTVQDGLGNTVTGFGGNVTVAIGTNTGGGTLSGTTTVAAVNGVATFSTLSINRTGTGYTLTASGTGLATGGSATFNVSAGSASALVFTGEPTNAVAGAAITPAVQVTVEDGLGNTVTSFTANVTVAIATNPGGGTLAGTATVAATAGVATFSNLSINKTGTGYTLGARSGGRTGTSAGFNIAPGGATQLVFAEEPRNTAAGAAITPAVQITAQDGNGNTATGFTGNITVAIGTNPSSGTLSGT